MNKILSWSVAVAVGVFL